MDNKIHKWQQISAEQYQNRIYNKKLSLLKITDATLNYTSGKVHVIISRMLRDSLQTDFIKTPAVYH
jgi:hypothetical protein